MKKKIIFCFILLNCLSRVFCFDCSEKINLFFDDNVKSKEFLSKNPLYFQANFYFPNLDSLKNKIVKETYEDYEIRENNIKAYGDSEVREVFYKYYIFDSEGNLSDEYQIYLDDNNYIFIKKHLHYEYLNNQIRVTLTDAKNNKITVEIYTMDSSKDAVVLTSDNEKKKVQIFFMQNKIVYRNFVNSKIKSENEYFFENNKVMENYYTYKNDSSKIKFQSYVYENGVLVLNQKYSNDGNEIYHVSYDDKKKLRESLEIRDENVVNKKLSYLGRKYTTENMLVQEIIRPLNDGDKGNYKFFSREIIEHPDTFFIKNFIEK